MYVLKDLWEGNITPADRGYRKGSPYAGLVHQANESEDESDIPSIIHPIKQRKGEMKNE